MIETLETRIPDDPENGMRLGKCDSTFEDVRSLIVQLSNMSRSQVSSFLSVFIIIIIKKKKLFLYIILLEF